MKAIVLDKTNPVGSELNAMFLQEFLMQHAQTATTRVQLTDGVGAFHQEAYIARVVSDIDDDQIFVAFSEEDYGKGKGLLFYTKYGELIVVESDDIMYAIPYWYDSGDITDLPDELYHGLDTLFRLTTEWVADNCKEPEYESDVYENTKEATAELMKNAPALPPASFPDSMNSLLDTIQKEVGHIRERINENFSKVTYPKKAAAEMPDVESEAAPKEATTTSDESETESTSEE